MELIVQKSIVGDTDAAQNPAPVPMNPVSIKLDHQLLNGVRSRYQRKATSCTPAQQCVAARIEYPTARNSLSSKPASYRKRSMQHAAYRNEK